MPMPPSGSTRDFSNGGDLAKDFEARFGTAIDTEEFPNHHQIVIVAASLDASSERIVSYLSKRSVAINVLCFEIFEDGSNKFLSRAWLQDPAESQLATSATKSKSPHTAWNGEFYVSFGTDGRSWPDAAKYGFVSAGGGTWYSNTLKLLKPGDRIWVKAPGYGFVGVGRVKGLSTPAAEFRINVGGAQKPLPDILTGENYKNPKTRREGRIFRRGELGTNGAPGKCVLMNRACSVIGTQFAHPGYQNGVPRSTGSSQCSPDMTRSDAMPALASRLPNRQGEHEDTVYVREVVASSLSKDYQVHHGANLLYQSKSMDRARSVIMETVLRSVVSMRSRPTFSSAKLISPSL